MQKDRHNQVLIHVSNFSIDIRVILEDQMLINIFNELFKVLNK